MPDGNQEVTALYEGNISTVEGYVEIQVAGSFNVTANGPGHTSLVHA